MSAPPFRRINRGSLVNVPGLCSFLGALLVGVGAPAASQTIRGVVVEASRRAPIPGTTIQLMGEREGDRAETISDSTGRFVILVPHAGKFTVRARRIGYASHEADTLRVGDEEIVRIEIRMDPTVVPLQPLIVTARTAEWLSEFEARRVGGFGRFLTRKDIDQRGASSTAELLRGLPGLQVTPQRRGNGATIAMRGTAGLCPPGIFINGVSVPLAAGGNIDELIVPQVIEAVEVYNSVSTAPIQYRTGTCGVVLFWTRRSNGAEGAKFRWWKVALGFGAAATLLLLVKR